MRDANGWGASVEIEARYGRRHHSMMETSNYVSKANGRIGIFAVAVFLMLFGSTLGSGWISVSAVAGTSEMDALGNPGPDPTGGWGSGWINDTQADYWLGIDSRNPAIATGPGGVLHAVFQADALIGGWNIYYSRSNDGGATWTAGTGVSVAANDEQNPTIAVHPDDGRIFVAWEEVDPVNSEDIWAAWSDDGATWNNVQEVFGGSGVDKNPDLDLEHNILSPNYYVYLAFDGGPDVDWANLFFYRSMDRGVTWNQELNVPSGDVHLQPEIAYHRGSDLQNRVFIVYAHGIDSTDVYDIEIRWSVDYGATWLGPYTIQTEAEIVAHPTIAASRDGDRIMVAWERRDAGDWVIRYAADHDPETPDLGWAQYTRAFTQGNGALDYQPKLAADGEGTMSNTIGGNFTMVWTEGVNFYARVATGPTSGTTVSGQTIVSDLARSASASYPAKGITTMQRGTGWYPCIVWASFPAPYEISYSTPGMRAVVDTNPTGLQVEVDFMMYTAPQFFVWPAGWQHLLNAISPQAVGPGTRYSFVSWSDGGADAHAVTAGTLDINYTCNMVLQYEFVITTTPVNLDVEVDFVVMLSPVSVWFDDGSIHDIGAPSPQNTLPGVRYVFNSWSDAGAQYHQVAAAAPAALEAAFDRQYFVDVLAWDTTNVMPLNGVQVTVDAVPIGTTPTGAWLFDTVSVDIGVEDPYFDGMNNFNFVDWSTGSGNNPLPYIPSMVDTLTANYVEAPLDYYSFSITPVTQTIAPGGTAIYTVTIDSINNYAGDVTLTASAAPGGLIPPSSAGFVPNPATVPAGGQVTSTLTIDNTGGATDGIYTVTVDGDDGGGTLWSNTTELIVATPTFDVTAVPGTRNIAPGMSTTYDITVSSVNNYAGNVALTATALPAGLLPPAQATFVPSTVAVPAGGSGTSILTIDNTAGVPDNTYTITIEGDDTVDIDTFDVDLVVATVPMYSMDASPALRSLNPGSMTTFTVTATSVNSYTGNVDVSVEHLLTTADASLSWDKTTLVVPAGGSDSAVLTVSTTGAIALGDHTLIFYTFDGFDNRTDQSTLNVTAVVDGTISGVVTDQDSDPLDDVTVELYDDQDNLVDDTTTNNDGEYDFSSVDAGTYTVKATKDGYEEDTITVTVTAGNPDQDNKDLELTLLTYEIEGDLKDEDTGDPIGGATVEIYDEDGDLVGSDTTSGSGHWSVDDLLPGTYTVRIEADGYKTYEEEVVITDQDEDLGDIDVTPKAEGNFLADYWWLLLLIIIIVVVIIIVALLARRKKPEPEEVPPGTYAEAQVPPEQVPPYQAPPEQQPYQPPPEQPYQPPPPDETPPEMPPEAPPEG
jgi:hypothetical protein